MKNLFLIIATALSFTANTFASHIGDGLIAIIKSDRVELTLDNVAQKEFILSSKFEAEYENLALTFESSVSMIQIFNSVGELEMMIPIDSKKINLGISLFEIGQYRMGFMIEGMEEIQFTNLTIK